MKKMLFGFGLLLLINAGSALAADQTVELGWMNGPPCSKVENVPTSIPGVSLPTLYTAPQELHAKLLVHDTNLNQGYALNALKECAVIGVAACGLESLIASPAACTPTFGAAFGACIKAKAVNAAYSSIEIKVDSVCRW